MLITVDDLEKELKMQKMHNMYLLYGEETFLLETCIKKIKNNFGDLTPGINYIKIDENNINSLTDELETPAFGYEKKLIIAKETGLFKKDGRKKIQANSEIANKINEYINENIKIIQESIILVIIEQEIDKNDLYQTIEKYGVICNFEELKTPQLITRLKSICKAYKVNADELTLRYLIECAGTNMQELINEIRKQIEYVGENGEITKQTIDLLCVKKIDNIIFDLTDNLGKKNIEKAFDVYKGLIYNKEPAQKILIQLYNHFKKLYIVKLCERLNKNIAENINIKPNQTFLISKYKKQSDYFKEEELIAILMNFIELDNNSKNGLIDLNIGLESLLCLISEK